MADQARNSTALAFLDGELAALQQRVEKLNSALQHCDDCLEDEALRNSLRNAEAEQRILQSLRNAQAGERKVSLESIIVQRLNRSLQESSRLSQNWRRGQATPAGYWEAELTREFLGELLRRYHAWHAARQDAFPAPSEAHPRADGHVAAGQVHPWFITPAPDEQRDRPPALTTQEVETLQQALQHALEDVIDAGHVEIVVEPDGQVIVTGYAHNDEQREETLQTILDTDGVREVVSDLKVLSPDECPACWQHGAPPSPGEPTAPPRAS